jgi:cytochrome c-type biogenesis protein CcmE
MPTQPPGQEAPPPRRQAARRRQKRMIIALLVIAVAAVVIFWGWSSTGGDFLSVASIVEETQTTGSVPDQYVGVVVEVRGIISDWNGSASDREFRLYDESEDSIFINVTLTGIFPEGFNNSKSSVVKGQFEDSMPLRLIASDISIGCSSKY